MTKSPTPTPSKKRAAGIGLLSLTFVCACLAFVYVLMGPAMPLHAATTLVDAPDLEVATGTSCKTPTAGENGKTWVVWYPESAQLDGPCRR